MTQFVRGSRRNRSRRTLSEVLLAWSEAPSKLRSSLGRLGSVGRALHRDPARWWSNLDASADPALSQGVTRATMPVTPPDCGPWPKYVSEAGPLKMDDESPHPHRLRFDEVGLREWMRQRVRPRTASGRSGARGTSSGRRWICRLDVLPDSFTHRITLGPMRPTSGPLPAHARLSPWGRRAAHAKSLVRTAGRATPAERPRGVRRAA